MNHMLRRVSLFITKNEGDLDNTRFILKNVQEMSSFLSQEVSISINEELTTEYMFTEEQLIELSGYSAAAALTKVYSKDILGRERKPILIACGSGSNGAKGLVCARHMKIFGYRPTLYYPSRPNKPLYQRLITQCEKVDIPFLSFLPSDPTLVASSYNLIVDALFGAEVKLPIEIEADNIIEILIKSELPIVSLDIPSGWDVDNGGCSTDMHPEFLISFIAPKLCARYFKGKYHYLGGRFIPPDMAKKYDLNLPLFAGSDPCVEIKIPHENQLSEQNSLSDDSIKGTENCDK